MCPFLVESRLGNGIAVGTALMYPYGVFRLYDAGWRLFLLHV